ncbi:glycosyltransferase [Mucilaginibacter terrenus]|uniref:glycosyltransferase n=1 Tax=Mucilaginibacter terrenus TaxID=2482727 RepID=UPI001402753B|nr:glycosyltransferase family A protein [Mucilaginibacter terrenus]
MYTISFCTAIRNRLHHLRQTLPKNLADNAAYPALEFIILDYNSNDGLEQWITINMATHLAAGKVKYIRVADVEYFERSKSRNMAFNAATGQLVCNIDADNFVGKGFAHYINRCFHSDADIFLTAFSNEIANTPDFLGRICCRRTDFMQIGGYNEAMNGYGFEDYEIISRLKKAGLKQEVITDKIFFNAITHDDEERIREEQLFSSLKDIYLGLISPYESDLLFVFKDGTCASGRLVDRTTKNWESPENTFRPLRHRYEFALTNAEWVIGRWTLGAEILTIDEPNGQKLKFAVQDGHLTSSDRSMEKVTEKKLITEMLMFYTQYTNRRFLNNDTSVPINVDNNAGNYRVLTTSVYCHISQWHQLLQEILLPLQEKVIRQSPEAFCVFGLSNYRGNNISVTWFLPFGNSESLFSWLVAEANGLLSQFSFVTVPVVARYHSTFMDFPVGRVAYGLYQFPGVVTKTLDVETLINLSRTVTGILTNVLAQDPIDSDSAFTLAFYLHALLRKGLNLSTEELRNLHGKKPTGSNTNLMDITQGNEATFIEIMNDMSSVGFINAPENAWMKQWMVTSAENQTRLNASPVEFFDDVSTLLLHLLALPVEVKKVIVASIYNAGIAN